MIKEISVENHLGETLKMELANPKDSGYIITSINGLGPGTANINTTDIVTNDGTIYNSAKLNTRNIVLHLSFVDGGDIEELRHKTYKYFPIKRKITLYIVTDHRSVKIEGYVESNDPNIFSKNEGTSISILCPDPYFYSYGKNGIKTTTFSGIEPLFEFPFKDDNSKSLIFGNIQNKTENVVFYGGDIETGIVITIHVIGEVENITIYNVLKREQMRIDTNKLREIISSPLIHGDDIIISTIKGFKYIILRRQGVDTNILNCLDRNSDWFTISKGDNIFAYTAETGYTNLQFKIENNIVYEGV